MRRQVFLLAVFFVLGSVGLAAAEVDVFADIDKDKDVTVKETVDIQKFIDVDVKMNVGYKKAAEAESILNQDNVANHACENCAEKTAEIVDSIIDNAGVANVNQAIGNFNNQANMVSVAVDVGPDEVPPPDDPTEQGFAHAQTAGTQLNAVHEIRSIFILFRESFLSRVVLGNIGIVGVNQSSGNINNQANMVTVGVSLLGGFALSETDLGQFNIGNHVTEHDTEKTVNIFSSISENVGIVGVNQTSGNMANQANGVSVAAAIATGGPPAIVPLLTP